MCLPDGSTVRCFIESSIPINYHTLPITPSYLGLSRHFTAFKADLLSQTVNLIWAAFITVSINTKNGAAELGYIREATPRKNKIDAFIFVTSFIWTPFISGRFPLPPGSRWAADTNRQSRASSPALGVARTRSRSADEEESS